MINNNSLDVSVLSENNIRYTIPFEIKSKKIETSDIQL